MTLTALRDSWLYQWHGANEALFLWLNHAQWPGKDALAAAGTFIGDHRWFPVYLAVALTIAYRKPAWIKPDRLLVFVWSYLLSWLIIAQLKPALDFPRPLSALGESWVHVVGRPELHHSFPSGHSTFVFLLLFSLSPGAAMPIRWGLIGLAFWVAWSRIAVGAHFPADVLGGALLGIFCVMVVTSVLHLVCPRDDILPPTRDPQE
ncbi:phosphatase PAP2 family protein [Halothiobacillus sp. DCM-1]|uniref:phosphatase PAP2 family protein n=1 Tax=Halothiobacillus sp. DCM-1 TaxID=3112558 RepID=UPI00325525DB